MELPLRAVIAMIIIALVLVVLSFFVSTTSTTQIQSGDANRVFNTICQEYKLQQCPWAVTREAKFSEFLSACRQLYGEYRDSFSCMYSLCQACKEFEPEQEQVACAGICESCQANERLGISNAVCCSSFRAECTAVNVACGACS